MKQSLQTRRQASPSIRLVWKQEPAKPSWLGPQPRPVWTLRGYPSR